MKNKGFDDSEIILFLNELDLGSYYSIGEYMDKITLAFLPNYKHPEQILLTYLSQNELFYEILEWEDDIWNKINCFSNESFIRYWIKLGYIVKLDNNGKYKILKSIISWNRTGSEFQKNIVDKKISDFIRSYFVHHNILFTDSI